MQTNTKLSFVTYSDSQSKGINIGDYLIHLYCVN